MLHYVHAKDFFVKQKNTNTKTKDIIISCIKGVFDSKHCVPRKL